MQYILVDIVDRAHFYPFSLTRSLSECRAGIFTFQERWEHYLAEETGVYTVPYLQNLYDNNDFLTTKDPLYFINVTCIPTVEIIEQIKLLNTGEKLISTSGKWIATKSEERSLPKILLADYAPIVNDKAIFIENAVQLIKLNQQLILQDFNLIKAKRVSKQLDNSNKVIGEDQIFIEEGATVSCSNLNASEGPIYIGRDAIVMEGVSIRGPFALGRKAVVKMNTSIYGATSIGPYCLAGGEIKNSILMGYSNKGHEGYLGDSIIGYWCNLGAGTCNSNIKNTAGKVQLWNEGDQVWDTIGQKMGMLVGDYSRFAIQSRINTGSYIGVSANIFGMGLLPKNLPNFTWGVLPGYRIDKAIDDINNWMILKGNQISEPEKSVLKHLYQISAQ
jgi:UDP-N-acetylglucosamine diphosphorylase/glucosamine-1-phosphate N-acetyltransferase